MFVNLLRITKSRNMKPFISPKLLFILAVFLFSRNQSQKTDSVTEKTDSGELDRTILPIPEPPFGGKIGETYKDSKEEWPKLVTPPQGVPNVIIILLDDVGFGQVSTFGGPVPTPELDKLADKRFKI